MKKVEVNELIWKAMELIYLVQLNKKQEIQDD